MKLNLGDVKGGRRRCGWVRWEGGGIDRGRQEERLGELGEVNGGGGGEEEILRKVDRGGQTKLWRNGKRV